MERKWSEMYQKKGERRHHIQQLMLHYAMWYCIDFTMVETECYYNSPFIWKVKLEYRFSHMSYCIDSNLCSRTKPYGHVIPSSSCLLIQYHTVKILWQTSLIVCELCKLGNVSVFSNMTIIAWFTVIISAKKVIWNIHLALFALEGTDC